MTNSIGWIGLGRMGEAMVKRLLKAGHKASVWNRTASKAEPLAEVVPSSKRLAVILNPVKVEDVEAFQQTVRGLIRLLSSWTRCRSSAGP